MIGDYLSKTVRLGVIFFLAAVFLTFGKASEAQQSGETTLDTLVVTAGRTQESLRSVPMKMDVIEGEDLRQSGASDVVEYLRRLGLQTRDSGGANYGDKSVVIRGLSSSTTGSDLNSDLLTLVDGRRAGTDGMAFIGLNMIDHIEIIRGPGAMQYGASAMGGVINIITKKGSERLNIRTEASYGSYEERKIGASGSGTYKDFDFALSATYGKSGDYKDANGTNYPHSGTG
jgi:vitamin B12 transporter